MEEPSKSINDNLIEAHRIAVKEAIKKAKETDTLLVIMQDGKLIEIKPEI